MTTASFPRRSRLRDRLWMRVSEDSLSRHSDFNKLWFGQAVSVLGSEVTTLALPLTAILMLGASAMEVGLLNTFNTVATLTLMLFAGVLVDRVRRRRLMIFADVGRALCIGALPVLALTDNLTMEALYAAVTITGALTVLFELAYFAYLPSLVSESQLVSANSRLQGTESAGGIAGANLGGALVTVFRPAYVLVVDAISFVVSAVSLAAIRRPDPKPEREAAPEGGRLRQVFKEIGEGIGPNFKNAYLRPLTLNSATTNFLSQIILTLFILYAARDLHLSAVWIGVIYGAGSVGGVAGAIAMGWASRKFGFGRALLGAMTAFRALTIAPLITGPDWLLIPSLALIWFLTVFGVVMYNVSVATLRQVVVPSELQGRVLAAHRLIGYGTLPIAALLAGIFGEVIGVHTTLVIAGLLLPPTMYWVIASPLPGLVKPEDATFEGGAARVG
ncbi:MAG TPA: MFS transporter [Solirubrobacteraceae bacterium]|jgi:MFS family permease|nr:MFS transporter [Solirubrobacteraceae bacterium]